MLQDREGKIRTLTDQATKDKETNEETLGKLNETIKALEEKMRKIQAETKTDVGGVKYVNLLEYDQPKGKILRKDRSGQTVFINLGSSDRVKPQLTFTVFTAGRDGRAVGEPKGTIEVMTVIGDHLSAAKITEAVSAVQNPIMQGDLLYNLAWSPGMREHVAIAGFIDLTGDGRDGTLEFKQQLENQGIIVDAYLDLRDLGFKGKGLTQNTSFLVLGEMPDVEQHFQIGGVSIQMERAQDILTKVSEIRNEATKLGVTIVPVRRFMALIGYRPPRNAFTADKSDITSPYMKMTKPAAPAGDKPMEDKP
jgi:hypothetical protein